MTLRIYKGYQIKPSKDSPHSWVVSTDGKGGKIPKVMEGMFTSPKLVMELIDNYVSTKSAS